MPRHTYTAMKLLRHLMLLLAASAFAQIHAAPSNENLLQYLDSLLDDRVSLEKKQEFMIEDYRQKLRQARNDEERYRANMMLYDIFSRRSIDSAMNCLDRSRSIAVANGDSTAIADLRIKRSFLLAASGLLMEAAAEMRGLEGGKVPGALKKEYYAQMAYLYDHMANYARINPIGANVYFDKSNQYKDSLISILPEDDHEYLWYRGWSLLGASEKKRNEFITKVRKVVDSSALSTPDDAKNAYILGCLYLKNGDKENGMRYVAMSAITDVQLCNRDIASLQRLAMLCLEEGDVERAHNYIGYCMEAALKYPNRVRASTIAPLQHKINAAYQEKLRSQERMRRIFLILVSLLSIGFGVAVAVIIREMRHLKAARRELDERNLLLNARVAELSKAKEELSEMNDRLTSLNRQLKQANAELNESNYVKEEYVGYAFSLCSQFIKHMDDFRRTINRKAKVMQWDDIRSLTEGKTLEKDAMKDFYANFDAIFLHLYPQFITDFNNLLQPGQELLPKEGELLSMELRIYALVRLGITDSVKIADFLHCSAQTVYNYRFRTRNKAILPKDKFIEAVKTLGHVVIE